MKQTRHWAEMQESGIVWGMRLLLKIYLLCGRRILQVFLYPVVSYYWLINKPGRQASRAYLDRVAGFSPSVKAGNSYRHFICFANALIDKLAAWSGALSRADVEYRGRDALMARIAGGRGAVLLGSHLGNLDVCRVLAYLDRDIRINVLVHTKHAEKFNRLLSQYNEASRMNLIQVTEITAATSMLLNDKIENGELVIITADRTPVSELPRVLKARFLGEEAPFPQGPFILAALLKCPVYTLFCLKQRGRHVIYFDHFSDGFRFPRNTREQAMQEEIQRYAGRLQAYCLKEPLQWFNFFDFWHG
ncbi:hypothetical protein [Methylobacter sp. BBA5.1]|uniref:LpxL/LpxP family acyltransferase n=1 Tax=Methylobacter sp. BBA5.1 TaxID=1495064 RepID=UPI00055DED7E|nr:hypothetical protein [Methylobacter sp. BBA5.1]